MRRWDDDDQKLEFFSGGWAVCRRGSWLDDIAPLWLVISLSTHSLRLDQLIVLFLYIFIQSFPIHSAYLITIRTSLSPLLSLLSYCEVLAPFWFRKDVINCSVGHIMGCGLECPSSAMRLALLDKKKKWDGKWRSGTRLFYRRRCVSSDNGPF